MRYTRQFHLSACHFNGVQTYERWEDILKHHAKIPPEMLLTRVKHLLRDMHGHDFIVTVDILKTTGIDGDYPSSTAMVIEDELLEEVIRRFDRCNWSVLPDVSFLEGNTVIRATTERVARCMWVYVETLLRQNAEPDKGHTHFDVTVRIQETRDIIVEIRDSFEL